MLLAYSLWPIAHCPLPIAYWLLPIAYFLLRICLEWGNAALTFGPGGGHGAPFFLFDSHKTTAQPLMPKVSLHDHAALQPQSWPPAATAGHCLGWLSNAHFHCSSSSARRPSPGQLPQDIWPSPTLRTLILWVGDGGVSK